MPSRVLRDGILTSERVDLLDAEGEVFYRRLMSVVDDFGRYTAHSSLLIAALYPLRVKDVTEEQIEARLAACVAAKLVLVYTVDGKRYLQLLDFNQQKRAERSKCPEPPSGRAADAQQVLSVGEHPLAPVHLGEGVVGGEGVGEVGATSPVGDGPVRSEPIPYQAIVDSYNRHMAKLPKVRDLTNDRRTSIRTAWQSVKQRQSLQFWDAYFEECAGDDFLNGTGPYSNGHEKWRPDFDYLIRGKTVTKVFEKAMHRLEQPARAS